MLEKTDIVWAEIDRKFSEEDFAVFANGIADDLEAWLVDRGFTIYTDRHDPNYPNRTELIHDGSVVRLTIEVSGYPNFYQKP